MRNGPTRRRACLLGLAALLPVPATAAAAAAAARRQPRRAAQPAQPPKQAPRSGAPAGNAGKQATATARAAPPWPQIDGPPPPSRRPGLEPAPVPNGNILPPIGERGRAGPSVSFGVPTPPVLIEGQSFRATDSAPQERQQQQQGGLRLPSPGATVRLPF